MVAIATTAAAQSWDYLKKDFKLNKKEVVLVNDSIKTPIYSSKPTKVIYDMYVDKYITKYDIIGYKNIYIPSPIAEEYKFGVKCYRGGCITISIGVPLALVGGILMGTATSTREGAKYISGKAVKTVETYVNQPQMVAGDVLLGFGCSLVAISIPLLTFGDHMKREANWKYRMQ